MKVLMVSSEVAPFSKTGGLADVAGALPSAFKDISGYDIRVISPFHRMVRRKDFKIKKIKDVKDVPGFEDTAPFELLETVSGNIKFYFVGKDKYFDRDNIYGTSHGDYEDSAERFSFFCKAVLAAMVDIGFHPDVIHANDWQTALLPLYKNTALKEDHPLRKAKILFTIHNLAYQGLFPKTAIKDIGLPKEILDPIAHGDKISFMKSGLLYADVINAVSRKYAEEILTPAYGCGLDDVLLKRKKDLYGILNGADYSSWNPETDKLIPENYGIDSLNRKQECKIELLKQMKLELPVTAPLLGSVGRLVEQKGVDIILSSIEELIGLGAGLILLGRGSAKYEEALKYIAEEHAGAVGISIAFDNKLAHMIEAGVDMFVMPSRYEPCGLNQMYSLKYGTIPIVRATGGLDDTIIDYSEDPKNGCGFKFEKAKTAEFIGTVKKAINVFNNREEWRRLQKRGMGLDFSWTRSAHEYAALYEKMQK